MVSESNIIFVYHHLGLGDYFICNGLIRHILTSQNPSRLYLPVKSHNFPTVSLMYSDDIRLICLPVQSDHDVGSLCELQHCNKLIQVGFSNLRTDWDVSFYETCGIPFSCRWSDFKIPRSPKRELNLRKLLGIEPNEEFILVHDTGSIGRFDLKINTKLRIITVEPVTECLFDWCGLIEDAVEVHCIDSSFVHLAQTMRVKRGVLHEARGRHSFYLKDNWECVDYQS